MNVLSRSDQEARYLMFDAFAINDTRSYYQAQIQHVYRVYSQVNRWRAVFSFLSGVVAAILGLLVQSTPSIVCSSSSANVPCALTLPGALLLSGVIVLPALSLGFSLLFLVFDWDEQYLNMQSALENLEIADAVSPFAEMDDLEYRAAMQAFTQGALDVMHDETVVFGNSVFSPEKVDKGY